ncbi:hypothetical protein Bhyg_04520 [Pseudolycoriella hygida]|uniref:Uncharacterized protein n=1 Tax=Pseudolycoriella hygida TaxID=35572 RepID=A0A9Q0NFE5_9DIPT|nr:hypothetical protein Bhyg_04520 [Pseudolycoriella hygida]
MWLPFMCLDLIVRKQMHTNAH